MQQKIPPGNCSNELAYEDLVRLGILPAFRTSSSLVILSDKFLGEDIRKLALTRTEYTREAKDTCTIVPKVRSSSSAALSAKICKVLRLRRGMSRCLLGTVEGALP